MQYSAGTFPTYIIDRPARYRVSPLGAASKYLAADRNHPRLETQLALRLCDDFAVQPTNNVEVSIQAMTWIFQPKTWNHCAINQTDTSLLLLPPAESLFFFLFLVFSFRG